MLEEMTSATFRASEVLESMRSLFRNTDQQQDPCNLNEIAFDALRTLESELNENGITTKTRLDVGLPKVLGHKGQLQEVVLRHEQPVYVYSSPYRGKTYCEQGILSVSIDAQKNTLTDLAVFFAQSCNHTRCVMEIPPATIESYLKDCLTLPEVSHKVQFLLDNLGMKYILQ